MEASGVEDVGLYFPLVALGGKFFSVQYEADSGGVACPYIHLVAGADRSVGGGDESFFSDGFAVGHNRDPGGFFRADEQREGAGRLQGWSCLGM